MADSKPAPDAANEQTAIFHPSERAAPPRSPQGDESSEGAGRMVGEFRLLRRLGRGGMAEVWLAEQTSLRRNVALKFLRAEINSDDKYIKRFETEAKAAAGLNHPNIVQVYSTGVDAGQHFIAQEYVAGQTLRALLQKKGPLDVSLALLIMRQTAAALSVAAERGIVHRDIKPENIMITRKGEVKVADFGLAQVSGSEKLNLTQEGTTMGTPLYMSPEQVNGLPLDQRSDIYSFGVSCYHMLTGQPPFNGESPVAVAVQHLNSEPPPIQQKRPDLPKPVCALVHRMMAKKPEDRYSSAQDALNDIRKIAKAIKDTGNANNVQLAEFASGQTPAPTPLLGSRPLALAICCAVLAVGVGAAIGYSDRLKVPESVGSPFPRQQTAREQFVKAMLLVDNEDAWLAVGREFGNDKVWTPKATEQLGLLYLRDRRRWDDAQDQFKQLQQMRGVGAEGDRYFIEGTIGLAALHAYRGQTALAKTEFETAQDALSLVEDPMNVLSSSWQQLRREVEFQVYPRPQPGPPRNGDGPRRPPNEGQ